MTNQLKTISEITPVLAFDIVKTLVEVQSRIMSNPKEWVTVSDKVIGDKMSELGVNINPQQGNACFSLAYIYDREMTDAIAIKWIEFLTKLKNDEEFRTALQEAAQSELGMEKEDQDVVFELIDDQIAELKSIQYLHMTALRGMYN